VNATKHLRLILCLLLAVGFAAASVSARSVDEKFPLLQIGTKFCTNATVTSVERDFICVMHSQGMGSIRVEELSAELRARLGCDREPKREEVAAAAVAEAKSREGWWRGNIYDERHGGLKAPLLIAFLCLCLLAVVCQGVFARAICVKVGMQPTWSIYWPKFQWFQLYEAAGMSRYWALLRFIPVSMFSAKPDYWMFLLAFGALELFLHLVWSVNITRARGKNLLIAILVFLPLVHLIGWAYLAYSKGEGDEQEEPKPVAKRGPIMTLETA
jgi:hypothetical protein